MGKTRTEKWNDRRGYEAPGWAGCKWSPDCESSDVQRRTYQRPVDDSGRPWRIALEVCDGHATDVAREFGTTSREDHGAPSD